MISPAPPFPAAWSDAAYTNGDAGRQADPGGVGTSARRHVGTSVRRCGGAVVGRYDGAVVGRYDGATVRCYGGTANPAVPQNRPNRSRSKWHGRLSLFDVVWFDMSTTVLRDRTPGRWRDCEAAVELRGASWSAPPSRRFGIGARSRDRRFGFCSQSHGTLDDRTFGAVCESTPEGKNELTMHRQRLQRLQQARVTVGKRRESQHRITGRFPWSEEPEASESACEPWDTHS